MRVSYHAGERFLQRVFKFTDYTKKHVLNAMKLIEKDISHIEYRNANFVLPSFPNYRCIVADNTLVTIIPK
ncbi:MAG: hypothetical protein DRG30_04790 [Epsilonproteobacteria bacterium]|nr:MAG: hypothetical protein DRG30_04790 [Campylobacterota bacterium]